MILTDLIKEQALESIIMFSAGLGLGMLHQVWSVFRKAAFRRAEAAEKAHAAAQEMRGIKKAEKIMLKEQKSGRKTGHRRKPKTDKSRKRQRNLSRARAVSAVLEFLFWPFAAFFVSEFMYYAAYGEISFHNFLALGLGVLLWKKAFYDIVY